ncbi:hypothetical protein AXF42_Ash002609 [Apostasia shenzhenica]|uniref:Uncharacterized protein n=1 Tax=Apostasia shenzhenica TaxID=1088818 RepID=A0A2I0AP62_9ASPA|nr:hypothetical protein AXF42_Ash002609 [Apostasia shenzhenica]
MDAAPTERAVQQPGRVDQRRPRATELLAKLDGSWASLIGLGFLTVNSVAAIAKSLDQPSNIIFVAVSYLDVILLFLCLNKFESASPKGKDVLRAAVWFLASLLTVLFCHRVAGIMPLLVAAGVWVMAAVSVSGSFYALFLYRGAAAVSPVNKG